MGTQKVDESKDPLEPTLDQIPVPSSRPIVRTDARGRTTWVNAAFETLTGYSAAEAIGRTPGSLLQCLETDPRTIDAIRAAMGAHVPIKTPILNRTKAGRLYWVDLKIQPIFGRDGALEGFQADTRKLEAFALARSQEAIMSNVADLTGVGSWEVNLETGMTTWSEQAARILDSTPEFAPSLVEGIALFTPESRPRVQAILDKSLLNMTAFDFEHPLVTVIGRLIWVRVVGRPLYRDGEPRRFIGALRDVTAQRAERESLRAALETAKLALSARTAYQEALDKYAIVAITDRRGDIVFVNDRFCEISGYDRDELMGRNHRILNSGRHPPEFFTDLWRTIASGQAWHGEICNRSKGGEFYWVDTTVVPLKGADGKTDQFASIRYDITERKTSDAQRLAMVEALNERSVAAEAATIAKGQFLATMSHELRTPMNGVIGMLDLLMKTTLDAEQTLRASTALESARSLLVILNDILDFSRLESGQVPIENIAFSPAGVVRQLIALLAGRAEEKGLRLSCTVAPEVPDWISGDPTRIRQVLINLVGNALKFTERGEVELQVSYDRDASGAELRFEVRDTGIGLSEDEQRLIFRRFVQADASTTRRFGGTGLGLAISKQLVDLMGGELGVRSRVGAGSTFWFSLDAPLAEAPTTDAFGASEPPADPVFIRPLRVLAADDHHVNRMVVKMYLESAGHHVTLVNDGAEALQAVRTGSYDLVLMDIQMPVMDGLSATRLIRALPDPACDVPIIALTANAMAGDRERYLSEGMTDYVAKPIEASTLLCAVARHCGPGSSRVIPDGVRLAN